MLSTSLAFKKPFCSRVLKNNLEGGHMIPTNTCIHIHRHAHTHTCTYTQTHMYAYAYSHTYSLSYAHAHIHTHYTYITMSQVLESRCILNVSSHIPASSSPPKGKDPAMVYLKAYLHYAHNLVDDAYQLKVISAPFSTYSESPIIDKIWFIKLTMHS